MRDLVTGGAGYIGSHTLVELLAIGHELCVVDNFSNSDSSALERVVEISGKKFPHFEAARASVMQQSRYLEAFVRPRLPDEAEYPKRLHAVLLTLLAASLLWCIGYLMIAAAKEHVL
jgi:nucleoside-diphosphate-sugar epimerase